MSEDNHINERCKVLRHTEIYGISLIKAVFITRILRVRIVSAMGLIKKDIFGTSDPYCKLSLYKSIRSSSTIGTIVQTKTMKKTLNPRWNEEFLFRVNTNENRLVIEMYDENRLARDNFLGVVSIHLPALDICTESPTTQLAPKSFKLRPRSSRSNVSGSIIIYMAYLPADVDPVSWTVGQIDDVNNVSLTYPDSDVSIHGEETLPPGWEEKMDQNGRVYYVDHSNRRTQWERPTKNSIKSRRSSECKAIDFSLLMFDPSRPPSLNGTGPPCSTVGHNSQLPEGWDERTDLNGRVYYVDHQSHKNQWEHPNSKCVRSVPSELTEPVPQPQNAADPSDSDPVNTSPVSTEVEAATMFLRRRQISHEDMLPGRAQQVIADSLNVPPQNTTESTANQSGTSGDNSEVIPTVIGEEELLPGWQKAFTTTGRPFFINHNDKTTTWEDPRDHRARSKSMSVTPIPPTVSRTSSRDDLLIDLGPLLPGWEEREHSDGRIFFVNHNNKTTQWEDPRLNKLSGPAVPYSRNYKQKYDYFRSKLRSPKETGAKFEMRISRKNIFEDSYRLIYNIRKPEMLKHKLWIEFMGEKGLDYGGVQREWFFLLSREMFNPYYGLFEYSATDNYTLQINPLSGVANENHLRYYKFIGRVAGMAVYHGRLLDGFFIRPIYKMMLGKKISLKDMESVDFEYYRSLKYILENDPSDLNLSFSVDEEHFGQKIEIDLVQDGRNKPVTQDNKRQYIDCVINWRFVKRVEHQMTALLEGFQDIVALNTLQIFDANELELLLCGLQDINVSDWKAHTNYKGDYSPNHPVIVNFWKTVYTFNNELRSRLLQFVTGTSRVPMNGFVELWGSNGPQRFTIERWGGHEQLPRAHTCFNRLDLPPYASFEELRRKLLTAIENTEGFEGVD